MTQLWDRDAATSSECCCKVWGGSRFGEPPWLSNGMLLHFPFTSWEEGRGFLSGAAGILAGEGEAGVRSAVGKLLEGAVVSRQGPSTPQVKCWQEAAPTPGSTQRDAVEFLQPWKTLAAALKPQKAPLLLAGFGGGAERCCGKVSGGARSQR